jgi:phosphomannomutase
MKAVDARLADLAARYQSGHTYTLDGFSAEFPDWHFNVRGSNTEPLLRLNLEATTPDLMARKRDEVLAAIRKA